MSPAGRQHTLTLYTRRDCHLCEQARWVIDEVLGEGRQGAVLLVVDIDADDELRADYGDRVPVVEVDGREIAEYRVSAAALRAALA